MERKIIETAAQALKISLEETPKYVKPVPEINGYYFWNPVRGGLSVLINAQGERLVATSSVSFEKHLRVFLEGRRN